MVDNTCDPKRMGCLQSAACARTM